MKINFPAELPISSHSQELTQAISENDVTIIVGETGSGKSTQIPKMILEALGPKVMIACTQPRRIAAVSIATRIAEECEIELGTTIGYKIRFDDQTYPGTKIIICTDGILLQEIKFDFLLTKYDAIFVDEAHERSLRIDFLLGLLKDIQKKRRVQGLKALKIIIASATLDTEKFFNFFSNTHEVPISNASGASSNRHEKSLSVAEFSVSGRMFPVDVEYHPPMEGEILSTKIAGMVEEIHSSKKVGDILIFLPGEQEISLTINAIKQFGFSDLRCMPLYGRLPMTEQTAIYGAHTKRHVVVSTNIAETSLTVPGVTVVIDSGLARMTDFNTDTGIGSLMVEEISQASAIQRTGRAGRIEPGRCLRLYSEENFAGREPFTRPEIQRSDLADVVLQMILMGIPNIHTFEFMDPPEHASFEQALGTLYVLGAINRNEKLTETGVKMAHLPLDPKISRMLLTAEGYSCVAEVAVIASFLSLKDPFWRPFGDEEAADKSRRYFQRLGMPYPAVQSKKPFFNGRKTFHRKVFSNFGTAETFNSDLLTYLAVWKKVFTFKEDVEREQYCKNQYLDFQTLEKAKDIYQQLIETLVEFYGEEFNPHLQKLQAMLDPENLQQNAEINHVGILKSVSSGLVQNLCQRNSFGNYTSAKVDRIYIHPSSLFYSRYPKWIIAAEIVETTKRFARNVTEVDPSWFRNNFSNTNKSARGAGSKKNRKSPKKRYTKRRHK
ncbi:MAG: ATP-dependent RNA helicase [Candidatus Gracilibacteria bacterium]|jgi:ATP-dependent helicase HrpA